MDQLIISDVWSDTLVGLFTGFVLLPLIYNAGLYVVMRGEFLIWHSFRAATIVLMTVAAAPAAFGLSFPYATSHMLFIIGQDLGIAVGGLFLVSYVEPGKIGPRLSAALQAIFIPTVLLSIVWLIGFPALRPIRDLNFLLVLILVITGVFVAVRNGSRAAKFQAVAWTPLFILAGIQLLGVLLFGREVSQFAEWLLFVLGFEIVVSAVGVSNRFIVLKRERDEARASEAALAAIAYQDPLTALPNRRAFEAWFEDPETPTATALAVVDLDRFKIINDTFGHAVGDEVLVATARALSSVDAFAARIGGEEFALIFCSSDFDQEAERARVAISEEVERHAPQLGEIVTASMGICELNADMTLSEALNCADEALYRAKAQGRARMVKWAAPSNGQALRAIA